MPLQKVPAYGAQGTLPGEADSRRGMGQPAYRCGSWRLDLPRNRGGMHYEE